ncbi:anti-sigma factor [Deinococcus sp. KNUC1210]|uniref:anti-sigma factor n=1 Tax=Deinococcus sp. KNUC1210 TaxID=2917691 RepID=UPI001EEFB064|nr:anti-sigma factor [Deinococcus sp. KNUC1210]ULH15735.1 anti-sigma factor [Deinococcus sp. KNUC1210]
MLGSDSTHSESSFPDSDTLMDYALGFLSPEEAARVEAALEHSPTARAELEAYLNGLSDLVLDLPPEPLPVGAEDRLLARLNAELPDTPALPPQLAPAVTSAAQVSTVQGSPVVETVGLDGLEEESVVTPGAIPLPPRRNLLYPLLGAAAVVVLLVAVLPGLRGTTADQLATYRAQPGAVSSVVTAPTGQPIADVVRLKDGSAYVQMSATVALPGGKVYQAWKIVDKKPVSLGLFTGRGFIAKLPVGTVFAVTLEPVGGSPQPTSSPLFAQAI